MTNFAKSARRSKGLRLGRIKIPWSFLITIGLVFLFGNWIFSKLPFLSDLFKGIRNVLRGGSQGGSAAIESGEQAVGFAQERLDRKGIAVTARHREIADQAYQIINSWGFVWSFWTRGLDMNDSIRLFELFRDLSAEEMACVWTAYGVRSVNNRQSPWAGFLWDETSGTLSTHIQRYVQDDGSNWVRYKYGERSKTAMLEWFELALESIEN